MSKSRLLTEILRPKKIEQLILPKRIRDIIGNGELKQNYLFHGGPGQGKCITDDTSITVRNIETGVIEVITIQDFLARLPNP